MTQELDNPRMTPIAGGRALVGTTGLQLVEPRTQVPGIEAFTNRSFTASGEWDRFFGLARAIGGGESAAAQDRHSSEIASPSTQTEDAQVFNVLVDLKVETSRIAMHLEDSWRSGLFRQLDSLLDAENWDFSDRLPTMDSYMTFLRLLILLGRPRRPGLGATSDGNIIAAWTNDQNRLTIECRPYDQLRWIVVRDLPGGVVRSANTCTTKQLREMLGFYKPDIWFDAV
jgi:hypothetical protein